MIIETGFDNFFRLVDVSQVDHKGLRQQALYALKIKQAEFVPFGHNGERVAPSIAS